MTRVKRGFKSRRRHKKLLKAAKGFRLQRSKIYRRAHEATLKAWVNSYRDRRRKKRTFRGLWIARISAACKMNDTSYSKLIKALKDAEVALDRKVLADLAATSPADFAAIVKQVSH